MEPSVGLVQLKKRLTKNSQPGEKRHIIAIIDELDLIVSKKHSQAERDVSYLLAWSSNPTIMFTLIGISNVINIDHKHFQQLSENDKPTPLIFKTYSENILREILYERVGNMFDVQAATIICRTITSSSGDCRLLLDLAQQCLAVAVESLTSSELDMTYKTNIDDPSKSTAIVKFVHAAAAIQNSTFKSNKSQLIRSLTLNAQVTLIVAMKMSQESSYMAGTTITFGSLLGRIKHVCPTMDFMNSGDLQNAIESLTDLGLIVANDNIATDTRRKVISLQCQPAEVEIAFQKTLGDISFFKDLLTKANNTYN